MRTTTITKRKNGTVAINGLACSDLMTMAHWLERVARVTDNHVEQEAIRRLASALRVPALFCGTLGNVRIINDTTNMNVLYDEPINVGIEMKP